jgi:Flp pilus assembly protein TadD
MGLYLLAAENDAAATYEFQRSLELDEHFWPSLMALGVFHVVHGRVNEALEFAQKAHALAPWVRLNDAALDGILMRAGDAARGQKLLQELKSGEPYGLPATLAIFHLACGDCNRATELFVEAVEQRHPAVLTNFVRPYERFLRATPAWASFMKALNLPETGDR